MEVDSPPSPGDSLSPRARIIKRLATNGVPEEYLGDLPSGFVAFVKQNKACMPEVVSAILPTDSDGAEAIHEAEAVSERALVRPILSDLYHESMVWLQWLMFEEEPLAALDNLANMSVGQSGICGAVWGKDDVAFQCRTCEHDPTCAICVPCFQNGNHKDHDYSIINTGEGCCDCGDETAWKPEGFCSKHRGAGMIQPLCDDIAQSVGPVLDALFDYWKIKLIVADSVSTENSREADSAAGKVESELTSAVVEMILEFCRCSESLLSYVSKKLISAVGLLDILVRAERFINESVTKKLHELLLKLLGEPVFKYEFGKAIINCYPVFVHDVVKACSDVVLTKYPLLSSFSVQILTVPTLTMRLVKEVNLLEVLLDCMGQILICFSGEDGLLQTNKWSNVFDTTIHMLEDIKFVMSHQDVAEYIIHERQHIFRAWLRILSFVQGMNPQKRETNIHVEEDDENTQLPFYLCHSISAINSLMVSSAFSLNGAKEIGQDSSGSSKHTVEDEHNKRHAKVARISQESSVSTSPARTEWKAVSWDSEINPDGNNRLLGPSYISLAFDCLRVTDRWLVMDNTSNASVPSSSGRGNSNGMIDVSSMIEDSSAGSDCFQVLSLSAWKNINYDVSSQQITMHIPFHWLLSFILKEALRKHYGESVMHLVSYTQDPLVPNKLEFFGKILKGCQPCGFSSFMMEHPLQIRVFCAQVRAGMWRKNGDAAITSYEMYRSAQLSPNALELDLFLLQICAAFAPADSYVRRILAHFGLQDYISLDLEPHSEFEPVLVQEMLALIIQIVKERRYCGFTTSENLQRELVCKLSTGDATRSQLQKSLPCDLSKVDLQEVLDNIAQYSNPSGMKQGRYSLRLSYWKELDLYHPRWNPRDFQIAEEKYLQHCGVSAMTSQMPKWTRIYRPLNRISRIATCKTVLEIVRSVLFYSVCDKTTKSRAPDGVLITALHLLLLALDICSVHKSGQLFQDGELIPLLAFAGEEINTVPTTASDQHSLLSLLASLLKPQKNRNLSFMEVGNFNLHSLVESLLKKFAELDSDCKNKLQQVAPDVYIHLFQPLQSSAANILGSASDTENHKAKARQRQAAILARMKAEQSKFLESIKVEEPDESESGKDEQLQHAGEDSVDSTHDICSLCHDSNSKTPVSLLILLQKSRLVSFVDRGQPSWDKDWQSDKGKVCVTANTITISSGSDAVESTKSVLPLPQLTQLVRDTVNEFACDACPAELNAVDYLKEQIPELRSLSIPSIRNDPRDKIACSLGSLEQTMFSSIQKEMDNAAFDSISMSDDSIIYLEEGFQRSMDIDTILMGKYIASLTREYSETSSASSNNGPHTESTPPYDGFGPINCDGIHLSSCGHAVHKRCLDRYLSSLRERYNRRMLFDGGHIVDLDQGEFLCPVCRRLANSVLPADHRDSKIFWELPAVTDRSSSSPPHPLVAPNQEATLSLKHALRLLKSAACAVSREEIYKAFNTPSRRVMPSVEPVFKMLCGMYFPANNDVFSMADRVRPSLIMWDTLKYSLISTEIASRSVCRRTSTSGDNSLNTDLNFSGGSILSLLLRLAQSTRCRSSSDILLRFRSILLFAASICCGFDESSRNLVRQDGKIQHVLKHIDGDLLFPDTQFWSRASDPVLSRDPFSTLMWILFCLPYPFMSHKESLISLVHMFYALTVTQGIIAYCVNYEGRVDLGFSDCLVTDIVKLVAGSATTHQYFVSNYIDLSSNFEHGIRLLSLPFLRRCALLYKLVNSSTSDQQHGGHYSPGTSDVVDGMVSGVFLGDLDEVSELENMFRIPPLDVVLEDKQLRSLVPKWICHFHENLKNCSIQRQLCLNPAVPFQLMCLPFVYQDLLQRYIKPRCPDCNSVLTEPALCLLCGRLCSSSRKPCCRESGCQSHAMSCVAGTGVFLLIKNTTVLLQRKARRSLWPSPYLDAFGEEDPQMRRGKPLYLNKERYSALNYMVASHGLDWCSSVLRQTTLGFFMV